MATVFVVEDDAALREELVHLLDLQGFTVLASTSFDVVVQEILAAKPHCVLLDLKLPQGMSGHSICREVRRKSAVPLIMLTSSDSDFDEVMSMNLGADDYVTKPYNPAVLIARIHSVLRRTMQDTPPSLIEHKGVILDVAKSTVGYHDQSAELTRNEFRILHLLMEHHDTIISRQELMVELWQSEAFIDDNTLTVNINRLRKSLASIGVPEHFLTTRRGQGYLV